MAVSSAGLSSSSPAAATMASSVVPTRRAVPISIPSRTFCGVAQHKQRCTECGGFSLNPAVCQDQRCPPEQVHELRVSQGDR